MLIKTLWDFNKVMQEQNKYAWPGGYPLYFICSDGEALSWDAVVENAGEIRDALISNDRWSGWHLCAIDVNWEDGDLYCAHTNLRIESAYAEPAND